MFLPPNLIIFNFKTDFLSPNLGLKNSHIFQYTTASRVLKNFIFTPILIRISRSFSLKTNCHHQPSTLSLPHSWLLFIHSLTIFVEDEVILSLSLMKIVGEWTKSDQEDRRERVDCWWRRLVTKEKDMETLGRIEVKMKFSRTLGDGCIWEKYESLQL